MTQNVIVTVVTVAQSFPAGTVDTPYAYVITDTNGVTQESLSDPGTTVTFANMVDGSYVVNVTKNGVTATAGFTVVTPPPADVSLQVPATVSVTFS